MEEEYSYRQKDLFTLESNDNHEITYYRDAFRNKFTLIEDLLDDQGISGKIGLDLTYHQLMWTLAFTDSLKVPKDDQAWLNLLIGADYLGLNEDFSKILKKKTKTYLISKGAKVLLDGLTLVDYGKKIQDITYLTQLEKKKEQTIALAEEMLATHDQMRQGPIGLISPQGFPGSQRIPGCQGCQGIPGIRLSQTQWLSDSYLRDEEE